MAYNSWTVTAGSDATAAQYNNLRKDLLLQAGEYVTSWGSANAQTFTVDAQIVAYVDGMRIPFKAGYTNTGAMTGNVNGIGAKDIVLPDWTALTAGDITAGRLYELKYDGTDLILLTSASNILGETILGSSSATMAVSFVAKKYIKITIRLTGKSTAIADLLTFNSDTGANYSLRRDRNSSGSGAGAASSWSLGGTATANDGFWILDLINETGLSKYATIIGTEGASDASGTMTTLTAHAVWNNTTDPITSLTLTTSTGTYGAGSSIRVTWNN